MSFLSRLFGARQSTPVRQSDSGVVWLYVRCDRCAESIGVRLTPQTDAQRDDDGAYLRKEILGNRCPSLMSVELRFDRSMRVINEVPRGATVITKADYERDRLPGHEPSAGGFRP